MRGRSRKRVKDDLIIKDLGFSKAKVSSDKNKIRFRIPIVFLVIIFILVAFVSVTRYVRFNVTEMLWKTTVTKGSDKINNKSIKYASFKNGLMRISNDGSTFINDKGEVKWTVSYNMKEPIFEGGDNYFLIADRNGHEFYIFDENGISGRNTVTNPIQKISLSLDGIAYILQSDEENSYVNVFRRKGEIIDLSIKTTLTGDGMATDLGASDDGVELAVAYVCLDDNGIFSKVTYYNFDEAGQNANSKRIVKEFVDELEDKYIGRVYYFNKSNSFFIYDGGVCFVSTKDQNNPEIVKHREFDVKMRSIYYNKKYLAIVFEDSWVRVFNSEGNILSEREIDFNYENFYISDDYVIFIYGNRVIIYDVRGRLIFDKEIELEIQYVAKRKSLLFKELLLGIIDGVECIRFY